MKKVLFVYQDTINGLKVHGHESRCAVIANALSERRMITTRMRRSLFQDAEDGEAIGPVDAVIIDGNIDVPEGIKNNGPVIRIADLPEQVRRSDNFLIAPGYGAERVGGFLSAVEGGSRLGLSAFPVHPHIKEYRHRWGYELENGEEWVVDGDYVLLIPGSNGERFYSLVATEKNPIFDTLEIELSGVPRETAIALIANARVVVTAASVSAIESVLLGKPTFLVQTNGDQIWNYAFMIEDGVALPFQHGLVRMYLEEQAMREALAERIMKKTKQALSGNIADYIVYILGGVQ